MSLLRRPLSATSPIGLRSQRLLTNRRYLATEVVKEGKEDKRTLVVLGAGWAGYIFLKTLDKSKWNIINISGNASFPITPLLPSAVSGALSLRDIIEPLRSTGEINFFHAWAESIDFENKVIKAIPASQPATRGRDPLVKEQQRDARQDETPVQEYDVKYDKLVIATGCYNQTFGTPGVKENAFFLKDIESAAAIRYHIYELMDAANWPGFDEETRQGLLTWVIVGGGPTGAELAAELHDLARSKEFVKLYPNSAPKIKVKLMDAAPTILSNFDKSLSKYALKKFKREGIEVMTSRKIIRVEPTKIVTEQDGEIRSGMVVWSTGNKASPLNEAINKIKKDKKDSLIVNEQLQAIVASEDEGSTPRVLTDVYAMGDCAQINGHPLPATAQVANQQGVFLANLLSDRITNPAKRNFKYVHRGTMTNIGGGQGIIQSPFANIRGRLAWAAWRGYYWVSSLSWRNKFNLITRWTMTAFLGRDTSRM